MEKQEVKKVKEYGIIIIGALLFCFGINTFISPLGLYNGGVVGISQIIRTIVVEYIPVLKNFEIAGVINFIINIPLLLIAYKSISKKFFIRTVVSVIAQTIFFTVIKIPTLPIIDDQLAACLIGGIITGAGIGITLKAGGSGGGIDILGVYFTQKYKNFSVGKLGIIINAIIYGICAILFELPTAIYSVIYTTFFSLIVDKIHYQNINTTAMIFTKKKNIELGIMSEMARGVTCWKGEGAYTGEETKILVTVISKYEINQLKRIVLEKDPKAFIIFNEGLNVTGNFEKRL
ncbi:MULTISPECIES: YitT family protein [unclassified Clostridium]|uniref:YitT family protein n=1 Tax=Clostridium TaxID=1485 RepID=UPI001C8CD7D3|nr:MULTISPECIES: YitT family protein [unclassified Clostridium]MBX9138038.1 YitT family protein [Clostridium sp. K12(2020)]MBX9145668.1 YitT family protein [Clostridium sp. K13]MDU2291740.1 YitT family protein [Clostridium celatum]MDU4326028.1 YitT family protein [Clostridium celatum]